MEWQLIFDIDYKDNKYFIFKEGTSYEIDEFTTGFFKDEFIKKNYDSFISSPDMYKHFKIIKDNGVLIRVIYKEDLLLFEKIIMDEKFIGQLLNLDIKTYISNKFFFDFSIHFLNYDYFKKNIKLFLNRIKQNEFYYEMVREALGLFVKFNGIDRYNQMIQKIIDVNTPPKKLSNNSEEDSKIIIIDGGSQLELKDEDELFSTYDLDDIITTKRGNRLTFEIRSKSRLRSVRK